MFKVIIIAIISLAAWKITCGQNREDIEFNFLEMRKYIVGIGAIINDVEKKGNQTYPIKKYISLGSGLVAYVNDDSIIIPVVVTAGHVIKKLIEYNLKDFYIRPSWADTISTKEYFGLKIPMIDPSYNSYNYYLYPDTTVDLGCIFMLPNYFDKVFENRMIKEKIKVLPFNSLSTPYLGEQVWIGGYPGHVQSGLSNAFHYSISTFKPGYIVWKPSINMDNPELKHKILVESNATFGNSGGPVFSLNDKVNLVGILIGGLSDSNPVFIGKKKIIDSVSKIEYSTETRAGVSYIVKAEYVQNLLHFVQKLIFRKDD